ncbi:MAG TPA: CRTAC1 family protein [Vicinamibacterales bacterium]|nr:CRTAC1 family protein [Vicinamibacterales bacterium]
MTRIVAATLAAICAAAAAMPVTRAQPARGAVPIGTPAVFEDVAAAAGITFRPMNGASPDKYLPETMGSGAAFFDADGDGWLDLFLVDGGSITDAATAGKAQHRLYRNQRNGTFADVTAASRIRATEYGMGACAGDVDNDGRIDLFVTGYGGNALYHNDGAFVFSDVTREAGVGPARWSMSCAFLDVDRDGDLDLFVANYLDAARTNNRFCGDPQRRLRVYCHPLNYKGLPSLLYRNNGKGVFTDVSAAAGLAPHVGNGLGVAVGDYDDDGWPDVFVANDGVPNFLFHNDGGGKFSEVGLPAGVSVARDGKPRAGMGTEFADYNGDGRLDLVVTNHEFETHSLFRNDGGGIFTDTTVESGLGPATLPFVGFGVVFFDFDNSGTLDLAIVNGHVIDNTALFRAGSSHAQRKLLFRNLNGRRLQEIGSAAGPGFARSGVGRTLIAGDVDNDGDVDLLVTNNGRAPELLRNGTSGGRAIELRLIGAGGNRDALGARVSLTAGGRTQVREVKSGSSYLGQSDLRVSFGLGDAASVDRVEIRWPGGRSERLEKPVPNQIVTVQEGRGIIASVPFAPPRSLELKR